MVQLSLSDILKNQFTKPLCPLLCVIVDQEEWLCTQEVNVLSLLIYAQKGDFVKNKYKIQLWPIFLSSIVFIFSLPPIYIYIYITTKNLFSMGLGLYLQKYLFCLSHRETY